MPLYLCIAFFIVLFFCEGCYALNKSSMMEDERRRYQAIEHPRHHTTDAYLDDMQ